MLHFLFIYVNVHFKILCSWHFHPVFLCNILKCTWMKTVSLSSFLRSIEFSEPKDEIISKTKFKWNVLSSLL